MNGPSSAVEDPHSSSSARVPPIPTVHGNLMFFRLPPAADRRFIEAVLRTNHLGRCLFFGAGSHRTAFVELTNKEEATAMYQALRISAPPVVAPTEAPLPPINEWTPISGMSTASQQLPAHVARRYPLRETVPLADLCLGTTDTASVEGASDPVQGNTSSSTSNSASPALASSSSPYAYLQFIRFRDHRVLVTWSPLAVDAFYQVGGVVPTAHPKGKEGRKKDQAVEDTPTTTTSRKRPRNVEANADAKTTQKKEKEENVTLLSSSSSSPTVPAVSSQVVYPKDCCQRCGSLDHFTRHCKETPSSQPTPVASTNSTLVHKTAEDHAEQDARGTEETQRSASLVKNKKETEVKGEVRGSAGETASLLARKEKKDGVSSSHSRNVVGGPASISTASPSTHGSAGSRGDHCKHCGSTAHFSRHCPSK